MTKRRKSPPASMAAARISQFVEHLAEQIRGDTGVDIDRAELAQVLGDVDWVYHGKREGIQIKKELPHSLKRLGPVLGRIVPLLDDGSNQAWLSNSDAEHDRIEALVDELRELGRKAEAVLEAETKSKTKGKKGKRLRRRDQVFFDAIDALLGYWKNGLKLEFTNDWQKEEKGRDAGKWMPLTPAAKFVYRAMIFIDRKRLPNVRDALRKIKAEE